MTNRAKPSPAFTLAERLEADAFFSLQEASIVANRSISGLYQDIEAGALVVEKARRRTIVRGRALKEYMDRGWR